MQQRCAFCVAEQKEISDGKARYLIPCITCWKCNLFSLSSCHEFCRRFATQASTRLTRTRIQVDALFPSIVLSHAYGHPRESVWRRAHSRFIHVLSCTNPHTYTVHFAQPLARELFESFIRRDSLLTRRGNSTPEERDGTLGFTLPARVFDASFDAVDQENGKRIRSRARQCQGQQGENMCPKLLDKIFVAVLITCSISCDRGRSLTHK